MALIVDKIHVIQYIIEYITVEVRIQVHVDVDVVGNGIKNKFPFVFKCYSSSKTSKCHYCEVRVKYY